MARERGYSLIWKLMDAGRIHVDTATATVYVRRKKLLKNGKPGKWTPLKPIPRVSGHNSSVVYWFVQFHRGSRQRKIALHRLIWLVHHGVRRIPLGCDICHADDDPSHNLPGNLVAKPYYLNRFNRTSFTSTESDCCF